MPSRVKTTEPCEGCGRPFIIGSNAFGNHLGHCTNVLLAKKILNENAALGRKGDVEVDSLGNVSSRRPHLESRTSETATRPTQAPFVFEDNGGERWELSPDDVATSTPTRLNDHTVNREEDQSFGTNEDAAPYQDTREKIPLKKDVTPDSGDYSFQISLMDLLQHHKSDLKLHNEIINLLNKSLRKGKINTKHPDLMSRKKIIKKVENDFHTTNLKPQHVPVTLSDGTRATVFF